MRRRVLQRLPTLILAGASLLIGAALLVWWWADTPTAALVDAGASRVTLDRVRLTNDGETVRLSLRVVDHAGLPLADVPVDVIPSVTWFQQGETVTDARGIATVKLGVVPAARHNSASAGLIAFATQVGTQHAQLLDRPHLAVYNRVAVLLQGFGTTLDCPNQTCIPTMFQPLVASVLSPLGYSSTPANQSILPFSYLGGRVAAHGRSWAWEPRTYSACNTAQTVSTSASLLRQMLTSYRAHYPYTTFELIGHSLGGLVALEAVGYRDFLSTLGSHAIDKVITIDSPVNGIAGFAAQAWAVDSFAGVTHLLSCSGQGFGLPLVAELSGLGDATPGRQHEWAAALREAGAQVLTVSNRQDTAVPIQYAIIDAGKAAHVTDRLLYDLPPVQTLGHGDILYPSWNGQFNPAWRDFTATLRTYLAAACTAFAPGPGCSYPSINRGA